MSAEEYWAGCGASERKRPGLTVEIVFMFPVAGSSRSSHVDGTHSCTKCTVCVSVFTYRIKPGTCSALVRVYEILVGSSSIRPDERHERRCL